ncbi:MAG: S9 family peptidase [Vulcanimicrobiaceae bacterium]
MLPSDYLGLIGVEDPQVAPDGSAVLYVRTSFDIAANKTNRGLWRVRDGRGVAFTQGTSDRAPRWSDNGRFVAFVRSDEDKKSYLYVMPADGGEPQRLGDSFARIGAPAWSPDGRSLAFAACIAVEPHEATLALDEESGARHIVALPYKSDAVGLFDGKRMQVHVVTLGGEVRVVAKGAFDAGNPAWSPDGTTLAFTANPGVQEGAFANDLYTVPAVGGALQRLTQMNGIFGTPTFSRDGREIAIVGVDKDEFSGRRNAQLWCVPIAGGTARSLTPDRAYYLGDAVVTDMRTHEASPPYWTPGDREIVVQRSHEGACTLVAYARDGSGNREIAGGELEIYAFSGSRDGTIALVSSDAGDPGSIGFLGLDGQLTRLPNENAAWLAAHPPQRPERLRPRAQDGTALDAWLLRAANANGTPAPLVHAIHGGPHGAYGWSYFFEFQLLASLGMHVIYGNPRGSQSYGEDFADAITGRWGDLDAADVKTILEAGKDKVGVTDRARIAVEGGSYGGLMTTWLLGHTRDYGCGISMRAVNDYPSEALASDIPRFLERELRADWSDGGRRLFEMSPIRGAAEIDVPLLVVHSERDFRCPIDQGEALFSLLRQLGKDVEFVRFTGDGHDLSRSGSPRNRLLRYRAIVHWLRTQFGLERSQRVAGWLFGTVDGERIETTAKDHDNGAVMASVER